MATEDDVRCESDGYVDEKMMGEEDVGEAVGVTIGKRKTYTSLSGHRFDYSDSTTTIAMHCAPSSKHVRQT